MVPARLRPLLALCTLAACGGGAPGAVPPAPSTELPGTVLGWPPWQVKVPPTLTATVHADAAVLEKADCRLTLWPGVPAQADLDAQALELLTASFPAPYAGVLGLTVRSPLEESTHRRGVTGEGWAFVELGGELQAPGGARSGERVRILLFRVGDQALRMLGWQAVGGTGCLDEVLLPFAWTRVASTVSFPAVQSPTPHALADALVGGWFGTQVGGAVDLVWSDVFAANGRHSDLMGVETYRALGATEVLETFSTWQGNGAWTLDRNRLTIWPSDPAVAPHTEYVRVSLEYTLAEPSGWRPYLYRLGTCAEGPCERWSVREPR